ncbi:hypothetical protein [Arenibacterium sp. LLYu02]|uniref:hypothetical protein n=1 Tax=Arenibacterium sp. LLYu02 TaxID=3404132 RepID=UPI003B20BD1C
MAQRPHRHRLLCSGRRIVGLGAGAALALLIAEGTVADEWSGRFLGSYATDIDHVQLAAPAPVAAHSAIHVSSGAMAERVTQPWDQIAGFADIAVPSLGAGDLGERISLGIVNWSEVVRPGVQNQPAQLGFGMSIALTPTIDVQGSVSLGADAEGRASLAPEYRQLALVASFRF